MRKMPDQIAYCVAFDKSQAVMLGNHFSHAVHRPQPKCTSHSLRLRLGWLRGFAHQSVSRGCHTSVSLGLGSNLGEFTSAGERLVVSFSSRLRRWPFTTLEKSKELMSCCTLRALPMPSAFLTVPGGSCFVAPRNTLPFGSRLCVLDIGHWY